MSKLQNIDTFRRPELFLTELLNRSARGELSQTGIRLRRAHVIAVDVLGGRLENPDGQGVVEHDVLGERTEARAVVGPPNPRNSIRARIVTDELDQYLSDSELRTFWPLFPDHDSVPVKPGELVYVLFEDDEMEHGLWVGRVSGGDSVNIVTAGQYLDQSSDQRLMGMFGETSQPVSRPFNAESDMSGRLVSGKLMDLF